MNTEKIIGIVLLIIGLSIIAYTLLLSFTFFTGSSMPPEIFNVPIPTSSSPSSDSFGVNDIPGLLENQLQNLLPQETIPKMLNFGVWSIFAGILIFAGTQISSLGIKLIKK